MNDQGQHFSHQVSFSLLRLRPLSPKSQAARATKPIKSFTRSYIQYCIVERDGIRFFLSFSSGESQISSEKRLQRGWWWFRPSPQASICCQSQKNALNQKIICDFFLTPSIISLLLFPSQSFDLFPRFHLRWTFENGFNTLSQVRLQTFNP